MSSSTHRPPPAGSLNAAEKSYFEQQREILLGEIAVVGNEFSSVEALWSQFENVMAKEPEPEPEPAPAPEGAESSGRRDHHEGGGEGEGEGEGEETLMEDDTRV
ncbi:Dolichyl-diphosphooligosaccharide-protein glycosyltransferase subunit dad1 [Ciborinia camelliae]|nr:Dolichyl-diphosphooligosaccharide-protein glycosyltransferase subunit dad1 [Ciborinia camelliae]